MSFESLDDVGKAGVVLALVGGLIGIARSLDRLLGPAPQVAWTTADLALAALVLGGLALAVREHPAFGGALAGICGLVLAVIGPTTAGVLAFVGGGLVWWASGGMRGEEPAEKPPTPGSS